MKEDELRKRRGKKKKKEKKKNRSGTRRPKGDKAGGVGFRKGSRRK